MKISVVMTTYNRRLALERCLNSLARQTFPADQYEVIVVADGCSDGTENFLGSYTPPHGFRWLSQSNLGQPAAQNVGVQLARGQLVIFMDDDCTCSPGLVAEHVKAHQGTDQILVLGAVLLHPDTLRGAPGDLKRAVEDSEFERLLTGGASRSDLMLCANSSIAQNAALECPFDPRYKRMHDVEAGLRLWSRGYRPKFAPDAVAYELFTKSVDAILSDARYQGQYEIHLTDTHPEFKPLAGLVRMNEGDLLKRWLRRQIAVHAGVSELALRAIYGICEPLRGLPALRSSARRILRARIGVQHLRGAIEAAGSWKEVERRFGLRTPVIIYHNVGLPKPGEYPGLTIPPAEFEAQIRLLTRMRYKSILPSDWLRWRDEGGELPQKPVMLVFDDAYEEAASIAFPIVRRYGLSAACMVVTSCIGATNRWDEETGRPKFRIMSAEQIVEWSRNGIEFGGHTRTHPELPFETDERVEEEVHRCKADLTELLGKHPASFAYPFGSVSPAAENAVRRNFALGFTSQPGRLHLGIDPAVVPRIAFLPGESRFGMWCRLRLGRNPFEVLRNRWRKWSGRRTGANLHGNAPALGDRRTQ